VLQPAVTPHYCADDLDAFLLSRAEGPDGSDNDTEDRNLRVIETHGARVYVGPLETFKIKRPVTFSYMDFSSLALRQKAIAREFEINHATAPDLYLAVHAITRSATGQLALDGPGETIEYVLRMRTFPQADILAERAARGGLDADITRALPAMVADYHAQSPVRPDADSMAQMRAIASSLADTFMGAPELFPTADVDDWYQHALQHLENSEAILKARADAGCVRRCHGDLHLGNIVMWRGGPIPFDAIEFDERIATVDTLYDLAFLIMDLDERGLGRDASTVLSRYLWRTQAVLDLDGLAALPLFLSLRAGVRAMVAAQHVQNATTGREADGAAAHAYFSYACQVLRPAPPMLIAVGGLSGTGKSTLAAGLAPAIGRAPGAIHLRSDLERKAMFNAGETDRLPPETYTRANSDRVYALLMHRAERILATGHSVIVDAVFADPAERQTVRSVATRAGVRFEGLWLTAPIRVLQHRVEARTADASDATKDVVERQSKATRPPSTWHTIDASSGPQSSLNAAVDACAGM